MVTYLIVWGIAFVVFAIIEALTPQLVSIWFALGSLVAFVAAIFGLPLWLQIVIFILISILALLATRPLAKRLLNKKIEPTNADRLIGKIGYILEPVDNFKEQGRVQIDGQDWSARSIDGTHLEVGTNVVVRRIEGVKLIVHVAMPEDYENQQPENQ
ncbi:MULTISPECIES: NfeD family protein [Clostridiaceae]|uniref:NfeD family protein n=1 Tax=Clostridium facile TaxID=2763035 RepID=A0ABR7IS49_9CLOT|nr:MULTISPECIES: NfeD family protein [Clostridiaceae]MBC5787859.1 NfeD family protein [Clostridium facile]PWM98615.1 MAG: NfeD family protein [Massilioclostridium sp.]